MKKGRVEELIFWDDEVDVTLGSRRRVSKRTRLEEYIGGEPASGSKKIKEG